MAAGASVGRPSHFFQPLLPGFHTKLEIPEAFMRKYLEEELRNRRRVCGSNNASLPVVLTKGNREWVVHLTGRILDKGWPEFIQQYYSSDDDAEGKKMDVGDIIVFNHKGNLVFEVFVFDGSTSFEKQPCLEKKSTIHPNPESSRPTKRRSAAETVSYPVIDHSKLPYFDIILRKHSLERKIQYVPVDFVRDNGFHRDCTMILNGKGGRSWEVEGRCYKQKSFFYIVKGWNEFISGNGIKLGECLRFQLINNATKPVFLSTRLQKKNSADDDHHDGLGNERLEGSRANNDQIYPYFDLKLSYFNRERQYIPRRFVRDNGFNKNCRMILKNDRGMEWEVGAKFYGKGSKLYISEGWNNFQTDNEIGIQERFRFYLIKNVEKPVLLFSRMEGRSLIDD